MTDPSGAAWFVENAREAEWIHVDGFGGAVTFEETPRFPHFGINLQVLSPGEPNGYYHAEDGQEGPCAFLAVGARNAGDAIVYPVSELAQRHGAGASETATDPRQAYAGVPDPVRGPYAGGLPENW